MARLPAWRTPEILDEGARTTRCSSQAGTLGRIEEEGFGQALDGVRVGRAPGATLKVGNAACAQPGLPCQGFLRQTGRQSITPQQFPEDWRVVCGHYSHSRLACRC